VNQPTRHNAHDLTVSFTDEEPPAAIEDDADRRRHPFAASNGFRDEVGLSNLFSGYLPR
jgi:hypothetical protein